MEVKGKVKFKGETKDVGTNGFQSRDLVVTTDEQYPQDILIQFVQGNCNLLEPIKLGDQVTVSINLRGREWTNPEGDVKYFNSIQGWKISTDTTNIQNTPAAAQPAASAPAPVAQTPVAPSQRKLVMIATDATYEAYIKADFISSTSS